LEEAKGQWEKQKKEDKKEIIENKKRAKEELKNLERLNEEWKNEEREIKMQQEALDKTEGLNKFRRPCSICGKPMLLDATIDKKIAGALDEVTKRYVHAECNKKQQQLLEEKNRKVSLILFKPEPTKV